MESIQWLTKLVEIDQTKKVTINLHNCTKVSYNNLASVWLFQNESIPGSLRNADGGSIKYSGTDVND